MDRQGADFAKCVTEIRERLLARPLLLQLPIGNEEKFEGVVDLLDMKAITWSRNPAEPHVVVEGEIPPELLEDAKEARNRIIETLCDVDDSFVEDFLEGREVTAERLRPAIRKGTLELSLVPVLLGSAFKNKGVQPLLDAVVDFLPSPLDIKPVDGVDSSGNPVSRPPSYEAPFSALAFKLWNDAYAGHLTFLRIYSGKIKSGDQVYNTVRHGRERIGRLLKMHANKREEIREAGAGDIVAAVGLKNSATGDTLSDEASPVILENLVIPEPVIHVALSAHNRDDDDRLSAA
jgi:elongation factor G